MARRSCSHSLPLGAGLLLGLALIVGPVAGRGAPSSSSIFTVESMHGAGMRDDLMLDRHDGLQVAAGWNVFGTLDGGVVFSDALRATWRLRLGAQPGGTRTSVRRLFLEGRWGDWALGLGRGVERLGRGHRGRLLLDDNAPAFDYLRFANHRPVRLPGPLDSWGEFRLEVFNGVLPDADDLPEDPRFRTGSEPVARPRLLGMRLDWALTDWLELGMSRAILYGGVGRERYDTFGEWWSLLTAVDENVTAEGDHRLDNDQLASVDFLIELPWPRARGPFERVQYYLEYAGTDLFATWQGDEVRGPSPVRLANIALLQGVLLSTSQTTLRVEHARTSPSWYRHSQYPQGYTHGGLPLGHPMGGDARGWFLAIDHAWNRSWRSGVAFDFQRRGWSRSVPETDRQWRLHVDYRGPTPIEAVSRVFLELRVDRIDDALGEEGRPSRTRHAVGLGLVFPLGENRSHE